MSLERQVMASLLLQQYLSASADLDQFHDRRSLLRLHIHGCFQLEFELKEHVIVSIDRNLLKKLIEKAEIKKVSVSTFIESAMQEHFNRRCKTEKEESDPRLPYQSLDDYLKEVERLEIKRALSDNDTKVLAADCLGISFRSLRHRLKQLGIE